MATLVVASGTVLLIAYGNGYTYDLQTGHLVHRGLIIIDSTPSTNQITLNGKPVSQGTPYRQEFRAGWYNFTLSKSGYRTWSKRVQSIPSVATLVDYVLLLPQHFSVDSLAARTAISQFVASRDHRHIAFVVPSGSDAGVWSLDTSSHQETELYPSAVATAVAPAETDTFLAWDTDNSRVLIKSQIGSTVSLLVVPTSGGGAPINVTATFDVDSGSLTFNPNNTHQLYWQSPDGLRLIDLNSQTVSAPIATNVSTFSFAGSRIIYVGVGHQRAALWVMDSDGDNKQELVSKLPTSISYELAYATYLGTPEIAVVNQSAHQVTLYNNAYSQPQAQLLPASATDAVFNGDGRFLLLSDASHVATYDLQLNTTYTLPPSNSTVTGLSWFDNYHLVFNRSGSIVLSEFDGNYATVITHANALPPYSSSDGKSVFAASTTSTGTTLIKAITIRQ